jgi:hypothetical protein
MADIDFLDGKITPADEDTQVDGPISDDPGVPVVSDDYKVMRALTYPSIGDQLDALFHAGVFPEAMAAQIQAVKDNYPKD